MNGDFELVDALLTAKEKNIRQKKLRRRKKIILFGAIGLLLGVMVGGAIAITWYKLQPKPPIPDSIKSQVTSTLLVPQGQNFVVDSKSVKYDSTAKLLIYNVRTYGTKIVFSEQPTPAAFTNPNTPGTFTSADSAYGKFLKNLAQYGKFDVNVGTVYLTRPPQQQNHQVAIIKAKGTLLFAKADRNLTKAQWQQVFSSLVAVH